MSASARFEDPHRHARRRDPTSEAAPERDAHAALDLLLETLRRTGDELGLILVEEEDRGRVRAEDLDDARKQLVEQDVERKEGKRGVRDALEITQPVSGYPRLHGRDYPAPYGESRWWTASLKPSSAARRWNS